MMTTWPSKPAVAIAVLLSGLAARVNAAITAPPSPGVTSLSLRAATGQNVIVTPSLSSPAGAAIVPADFVGISIETAFLNSYANDFSENLVSSLASRMSQPPVIRVGGITGDRLLFEENLDTAAKCIAGDCATWSGGGGGAAATFLLGPQYFEGFERFQDASISFQAPMAAVVNVSGSLGYVRRAFDVLRNRVDSIALGDRVTEYEGTAEAYVRDAQRLAGEILDSLGMAIGSLPIKDYNQAFFEVANLAGFPDPAGEKWTMEDAFKAGIDNPGNIKYAAAHWYQVADFQTGDADLQADLMNHTAITARFGDYMPAITYLNSQFPQVRYVLSEVGSATTTTTTTTTTTNSTAAGADQIQVLRFAGCFGAALWFTDFQLAAMSRGVARVGGGGAQRPAAIHSLWVPDASAAALGVPGPGVRPLWAAAMFAADFVGQNPGAVAEIEVDLGLMGQDDGRGDVLSAYAMYDAATGKLAKVALVNLREWSAVPDPPQDYAASSKTTTTSRRRRRRRSASAARRQTVFSMQVGPVPAAVTVRRLRADSGAGAMGFDFGGPAQNVTWAGQQWSHAVDGGKGAMVGDEAETVQVVNGTAFVTVPDSEAVIVYVES